MSWLTHHAKAGHFNQDQVNLLGPLWRIKYTSVGTYAPANGTITFVSNPSATATVTIGGTVVTFVTSGTTGNQVIIGLTLAATLAALVAFLNNSSDPNISKATYTASATVLTVAYTGVGAFALAASVATAVSAAGLTTLQVDCVARV